MIRDQKRFALFALAGGFLMLLGGLAWLNQVLLTIWWCYLALSLLTMTLYGRDKWAATRQRRRTPEATLQVLSLLGGWPGGLMGQLLFNHKTTKQPFQTIFWLTVVANVAALALLHSTWGQSVLNLLKKFGAP